jgi:orotidine-5'-phosphate decarboxylase
MTLAEPFADRLAALVDERRSQICLGLDPDPATLPHEYAGSVDSAAEAAGAAVTTHCRQLIDAAGPACVAVKLQLACFERLGAPGWAALQRTAGAARDAGLLVIADGKRGDVPVTAAAYGQALVGATETPWGPVAGLGADAFTANPLLGADALEPLIEAAARAGAGLFALVRTTNPGAGELQDQPPEAPLHERLAALVDAAAERLAGSGELSGMGAVVGATAPQLIERLRVLMPRAIFLIPGVGAQGGRPRDLGAAFAPGAAAALVAASRGIAAGPDPAAAAERLRGEVWDASGA